MISKAEGKALTRFRRLHARARDIIFGGAQTIS